MKAQHTLVAYDNAYWHIHAMVLKKLNFRKVYTEMVHGAYAHPMEFQRNETEKNGINKINKRNCDGRAPTRRTAQVLGHNRFNCLLTWLPAYVQTATHKHTRQQAIGLSINNIIHASFYVDAPKRVLLLFLMDCSHLSITLCSRRREGIFMWFFVCRRWVWWQFHVKFWYQNQLLFFLYYFLQQVECKWYFFAFFDCFLPPFFVTSDRR